MNGLSVLEAPIGTSHLPHIALILNEANESNDYVEDLEDNTDAPAENKDAESAAEGVKVKWRRAVFSQEIVEENGEEPGKETKVKEAPFKDENNLNEKIEWILLKKMI